MRTTELDKALFKFLIDCKADLISRLNSRGHKDSGKLEKSIKVELNKTTEGYGIEIEAKKYLIYLDDGDFIKKFLEEETVKLKGAIIKGLEQDLSKLLKDSNIK